MELSDACRTRAKAARLCTPSPLLLRGVALPSSMMISAVLRAVFRAPDAMRTSTFRMAGRKVTRVDLMLSDSLLQNRLLKLDDLGERSCICRICLNGPQFLSDHGVDDSCRGLCRSDSLNVLKVQAARDKRRNVGRFGSQRVSSSRAFFCNLHRDRARANGHPYCQCPRSGCFQSFAGTAAARRCSGPNPGLDQ